MSEYVTRKIHEHKQLENPKPDSLCRYNQRLTIQELYDYMALFHDQFVRSDLNVHICEGQSRLLQLKINGLESARRRLGRTGKHYSSSDLRRARVEKERLQRRRDSFLEIRKEATKNKQRLARRIPLDDFRASFTTIGRDVKVKQEDAEIEHKYDTHRTIKQEWW